MLIAQEKVVTVLQDDDENYVDGRIVVHGDSLEKMTSDEWDQVLDQDSVVFARTTPAQKLIIIKV